MSKSEKPSFATRYDTQTRVLAQMLGEQAQSGTSADYFMTLTFNRYHDRYVTSHRSEGLITRAAVKGGLTRKMPPSAAIDLRLALIRRFYVRLCRKLLGRNWAGLRNVQPRGIGWLDAPVAKNARALSPFAWQPGNVFEHAHLILAVPTLTFPGHGSSIQERFEELYALGEIQRVWRSLQNEGEVHVVPAWNTYGALDYSAKTAKRHHAYSDYMILLPR